MSPTIFSSDSSLIYLASPYSHADASVRDNRFTAVCRVASGLLSKGFLVHSPIAHSHPIATVGELSGHWEQWKALDLRMLDCCDELWVVDMDGWMQSVGIHEETSYALGKGKPCWLFNAETMTKREIWAVTWNPKENK